MNKLLFPIIALIIVVAGFVLIGGKKEEKMLSTNFEPSIIESKTTQTPTGEKQKIITAILTSTGFLPKSITIKEGTVVVWVNKSGKAATVSSNDHPTHRLYPFLNLGEFKEEVSLKIAFDKPGIYSYHDHYNASRTGIVTVE